MKICKKETEPRPIPGHIYTNSPNEIYICTSSLRLHSLLDGGIWNDQSTFGYSNTTWTDVTDKYCLKEI